MRYVRCLMSTLQRTLNHFKNEHCMRMDHPGATIHLFFSSGISKNKKRDSLMVERLLQKSVAVVAFVCLTSTDCMKIPKKYLILSLFSFSVLGDTKYKHKRGCFKRRKLSDANLKVRSKRTEQKRKCES